MEPVAKGKRRNGRGEGDEDLASADTVAVADSRDPDARVPTVKQVRRGGSAVTSPSSEGLALRRGDEVGRFIVEEKIGEGGMAVVYSAHDPRLDRIVALKLMRPDAGAHESPKQSRRRLLREAQALARLSHPNVVVVHEVDEVQGQVYVAMEYVDGGTLREWRRERPRAWPEVVDIYCRAGRGLAAAHRAGLVHRDFKPENVLVGGDGRVRVTDFGLVGTTGDMAESTPPVDRRGRFPSAGPLSSETEPRGVVLGTPGYVAPELYRGHSAGERSDQFSFCVSLFEALYEQRPFAGENAAEVATNMIDGKLLAAPKSSDVPSWIGEVLRRGLATDPADRYPSVTDLIAVLGEDPEAARRHRRRTIAAVFGFAALAAIAVIGFTRTAAKARAPCADAGAKLATVWNDERRQAMRDAFEATRVPYALNTYQRVAGALDSYARGWAEMRVEACEATHVRGEQSEAALDARMWCLDRRLGELTAYVGLVSTDVDRKLVERAVGTAGALLAPCCLAPR